MGQVIKYSAEMIKKLIAADLRKKFPKTKIEYMREDSFVAEAREVGHSDRAIFVGFMVGLEEKK